MIRCMFFKGDFAHPNNTSTVYVASTVINFKPEHIPDVLKVAKVPIGHSFVISPGGVPMYEYIGRVGGTPQNPEVMDLQVKKVGGRI